MQTETEINRNMPRSQKMLPFNLKQRSQFTNTISICSASKGIKK